MLFENWTEPRRDSAPSPQRGRESRSEEIGRYSPRTLGRLLASDCGAARDLIPGRERPGDDSRHVLAQEKAFLHQLVGGIPHQRLIAFARAIAFLNRGTRIARLLAGSLGRRERDKGAGERQEF